MNVVVRHQAEALAALGHTVDILTRRSSATLPDFVDLAPGVTLRFLDAGPAEPVAKGDHESFVDEFRARMSALGPWDVIHSHHWFSGMAALPLARLTGTPHVQSFHSIAAPESSPLSWGERPESPGRLAGEAWLAQQSDAVIAISEAEADTVLERLGGSADRLAIVPPGVDGTLFRPSVSPPSSPGQSHPLESGPRESGPRGYAIVAARLQPLKGLDLAIEAVAAVAEDLRPDLIIAGDASSDFDGYVDELRELAAARGIADGVRFVGPQSREDLATLLSGAQVVLVPSHSETYGLVALEGAASGVPVVAAAAGGLREAVIDSETGLVMQSRDPALWAAAIARIVSDPAFADRLSHAGRERAELLSWERSAAGLAAVYRALLHPDAAGRHQELAIA
ncbi:glycosyltransferase [Cryobacterium frigoriphilum]|uniref:D-inositol 3-phosphate glycosyltransferase n=2 Tax=Cryobacterium frigoriphilum TaxID=1259150 RepID=A0A4R9A2C3_9MICO|nr:glycosyltransferase [Cryobacterium frigoriphilum]